MSSFTKMFSSSIGNKILVALTGLFLCSFLIIHVSGNLQLFYHDNGMAFNTYTVFMTTNPLIKTVSYILYVSILFHAFKGLHLAYKNKKARPVSYAVTNASANSHWASRNMGVLGTILLVFIVVHMSDFWYEYKFGHLPFVKYEKNLTTGEITSSPFQGQISGKQEQYVVEAENKEVTIVKDLYAEVQEEFKNPLMVALYVIAMAAVSFHLFHGFKSGFQTLGLNHKKYNGIIRFLALYVFAIIIPVTFAAMPVYFFLK